MQQTDKYKLNLIERGDTFSPDALNENTEKMEQELTRLEGADAAQTAARQALDQRVTALEVHHITIGTYRGDNSPGNTTWRTIPLDFVPEALLIQIATSNDCRLILRGHDLEAIKLSSDGFQVCNPTGGINYNLPQYQYIFVALA